MACVTLKDAPAEKVITTYAALLKRQGKVCRAARMTGQCLAPGFIPARLTILSQLA